MDLNKIKEFLQAVSSTFKVKCALYTSQGQLLTDYSTKESFTSPNLNESEEKEEVTFFRLSEEYVLVATLKDATYLLPYLKALFEGYQDKTESQEELRGLLVTQIANAEYNREIDTYMKALSYQDGIKRTPVLYSIPYSYEAESNIYESFSSFMHSLSFSDQDIYGRYSEREFFVFYAKEENAEEVCSQYKKQTALPLFAFIGSTYNFVKELKAGCEECFFLARNRIVLEEENSSVLRINSFIGEYFSSLIPADEQKLLYSEYENASRKSPHLFESGVALSKSNTNLVLMADLLSIHRNTAVQRYKKLKSTLDLDPIYNDVDRFILKSFSLYKSKRITLNAGIIIQPGCVLNKGMLYLAELLNQKSGGTIQLDIHTLSYSGDNHTFFSLLCQGAIDIFSGATNVLNAATGDRAEVLSLPFLFKNTDEALTTIRDVILPELDAPLLSIGAHCMGIWSMGWRYLTSSTPIRSPEDLKGLKVRIMFNKSLSRYFESLGAKAIQMNYGELQNALKNKLIDCQENPFSNILEMEFYKWQQYIMNMRYLLSTEGVFISKKAWSAFSDEQKEIFTSAINETTTWLYKEQEVFNEQCKETLINEKGMTLITPNEEEKELWKKAALPLYESFPHQEFLSRIIKRKGLLL